MTIIYISSESNKVLMASANHFNHWAEHMSTNNFMQMTNFIDATVQGQKLEKFLCLCGPGGTGKTTLANEIINYINGAGKVAGKVYKKPTALELQVNLIAFDGYEKLSNGMIKEILGTDPILIGKDLVTPQCNVIIVTIDHFTEPGMNVRAIYINLF